VCVLWASLPEIKALIDWLIWWTRLLLCWTLCVEYSSISWITEDEHHHIQQTS